MQAPKQLAVVKQALFMLGTLCVLVAALGALFFFSLRDIQHRRQTRLARGHRMLEIMDGLVKNVALTQNAIFQHVLSTGAGPRQRLEQNIHGLDRANVAILAEYETLIREERERSLYASVSIARQYYVEQTEAFLVFSSALRDAEVTEAANARQLPACEKYLSAAHEIIEDAQRAVGDVGTATSQFLASIRRIGNVLAGIAILMAIGTAFAVTGFARRIKEDNRLLQLQVTERTRAESTLRESEDKFHQLADNLQHVLWVTSPDMTQVHYVSPAYEQVWGQSVESLHANPTQWSDAVLPEDRAAVAAAFSGLAKDQPNVRVVFRIVHPDRTVRWISSRGFQVRDTAGKVIRLTGISSDITERKQTECALVESERRFSDMLRNLELVSMMLDHEGRITYCNDFLLRLTGWRREEVIGMNWFEHFLPPEYVSEMKGVYSALLADDPIAWHYDYEILTRDNTRRLIRWNNSVLRSDSGEVIGTASIGEDITERKRLEAQLIQSQRLETVGKLSGGIAHEFNSILTAIIGQSELLLGDLPVGSPLSHNVIEISKAANRAATLTQQLLAYGRKQFLQPEFLDLNRVLSNMEAAFQHVMGGDVDIRILPAMGLHLVKADAGQIEHVIMDIVINARDAMPNGGKLTIETGNVTFDAESVGHYAEVQPGDYVMLAITDTGAGMSEEVKARVFEPFFTTKAVGEGTGLGLSTCYGIIKQSGGHINVYTEPGRGTTFKLYLPEVQKRAADSMQRLDSFELPRGTETILLVEDDPALREMAATLLRRLGYTVLSAANGIEALRLKQKRDVGHIDLLFTDVVMPHMNGKELAERMAALYPYTKVLFTSTYTENTIVHQGVLNKGVALLQKPFTPSALAYKLREVLDQPGVPKPDSAQHLPESGSRPAPMA